ncbi:MAG TPA: hypothetical protein VLA20_03295, partial [Vicinamibacterales bacterium]|nr:hypothetical protein [Vicinamibacterales bacterium]
MLALLAWLLPGLAFLVLGVLFPLRRSGRPAAVVSVLAIVAALGAALLAWRAGSTAPGPETMLWAWLPEHDGVLAEIGVLADPTSLAMLVLVALVASLVQIYSLGYLDHEPPGALGRYY